MMDSHVELSVEPEPTKPGGGDYKVRSDNLLGKTLAHTHRIPTTRKLAFLTSNNRRCIRHGCKKKSEMSSACGLEVIPTRKHRKQSKENGNQTSEAHFVKGLCVNAVGKE